MAEEVLSYAYDAYTSHDHASFANALLLSPSEPSFSQVSDDLYEQQLQDVETIQPLVQSFFAGPEDRHLVDFFTSLFVYIANFSEPENQEEDGGDGEPLDPDVALSQFDEFSAAYGHAASIFNAPGRNSWFVPAMRKLTTQLVYLARRADKTLKASDRKPRCLEAVTRSVNKPFNIATADRGTDAPGKRDLMFFLANVLFQLYFDIDKLQLCGTVIKPLTSQLDRLPVVCKADQTMYHFWRGRIHLTKQRVRQAHEELSQAFQLCTNQSLHNKRIIAIYLIGASLPLGILPQSALLDFFDLSEHFSSMILAVRQGNIHAFRKSLRDQRGWLARRGLWILLREKGEVIVWRSLVRRVALLKKTQFPAAFSAQTKGPPPSIQYDEVHRALVRSSQDRSYTMDDTVAILASLIDQGYIKGYLLQSRACLVLGRGTEFGFVPPSSVRIAGDYEGEAIGDVVDSFGADPL